MSAAPTLVSVVIPVYNGDRFLTEALESVLAQDYPHVEIIVVDDGSTDNTAAVIRQYQPAIQAIFQRNAGVAIARNRGIEAAQGAWIAFLDADDVFLPGKLTAQITLAEALPHLGIVHSGWRRISHQGEPLMDVELWRQVPTLNLESWLRWKPVLPSAMIIQKEWLTRAGGFDPRFPPAEDTELMLRLARLGCEADWLRQVTVLYRQHEGSAMHKGIPQARSLAAVIDDFFEQPDLPEFIRWQESSIRYNTLVWIAWYLYHTGHPVEMVEYLMRSRQFNTQPVMQMLVHWADSFAQFSQNWGDELDADTLVRTPTWQGLMGAIANDLR